MDDARLQQIWEPVAGPVSGWEGLSTLLTFRRPVGEDSTVPQPTSPLGLAPGAESFECFEEIGRGGMGVVFRARQTNLDRDVAVKTLRDSRSGPEQFQQFLGEARLHGRLEHPNILPVHTLGSRDGAPFLAMKLVEGMAWKERLRERPEALDEHLEILLAVCNAVGYAHSRGVVHADLKPTNVLLGSFGEVQLMDWGVAVELDKASGRPLTPIVSGFGTPSYMPPELAQGEGGAVGSATDVYLLGGLLYEILSGRPPRQGTSFLQVLARASLGQCDPLPEQASPELAAICRRALEPRPEARFADAAGFQRAVREFMTQRESHRIAASARQRLASTRSALAGLLLESQPDEETRNRLYRDFAESVAGFGQALELWQANEPAARDREQARLAWARSALQLGDHALCASLLAELESQVAPELRAQLRLRRVARANAARAQRRLRWGLIAALALLVLGLAGGLFLRERTNQEIAAERDAATDRALQAQGALDDLTEKAQQVLLEEWGDQRGREVGMQLLAIALQRWYELYDAQIAGDPSDWASAMTLLHIARLEHRLEGNGSRVWEQAGQAFTILENWHARQPDNLKLRRQLVQALNLRAELQRERGALAAVSVSLRQAQRLCREVHPALAELELAVIRQQALAAAGRGAMFEACQLFEAHLEGTRVLAVADTGQTGRRVLANSLHQLARVHTNLGEYAVAQPLIEEARDLLAPLQSGSSGLSLKIEHARVRSALADVLGGRGQLESSAALRAEGVAFWRAMIARDPGNFLWNRQLCHELDARSETRRAQGQLETAGAGYEESIEVWRRLAERDTTNLEVRALLYTTMGSLGNLRLEQGSAEDGRERLQQAVSAFEALDIYGNPRLQRLQAATLTGLAHAFWQCGQFADCVQLYEQAIALMEAVAGEGIFDKLRVANLQLRLAACYDDAGRYVSSAALLDSCTRWCRAVLVDHPGQRDARIQLANALERHVLIALDRDELTRAADVLAEVLELRRSVLELDPSSVDDRCFLADALNLRAELDLQRQAPEAASRRLDEAMGHWDWALQCDATQLLARFGRSRSLCDRADLLAVQGEQQEALALLESVLNDARQLHVEQPWSVAAMRLLSTTLVQVGRLLGDLGRHDEALVAYDEALGNTGPSDGLEVNPALLRSEILYRIGRLQSQREQHEASRATLQENLALLQGLASRDQRFRGFDRQLAVANLGLAEAWRASGDLAAALPYFQGAVTAARRGLTGGSPLEQCELARYLTTLAGTLKELHMPVESLAAWQEAVSLYAAAGGHCIADHASALAQLGGLQLQQGAAAEASFQQALELRRSLAAHDPAGLEELQRALYNLAVVGEDSTRIALLAERLELGFERLSLQQPQAPSALLDAAELLADILHDADAPAASCQVRGRALDSLRVLLRSGSADEPLQKKYSISLFKLGEQLCALGQPAAAVDVYSELELYGLAWFRVYRLRGLARALAGDRPGALADLARQLKQHAEPYTVLWRVGLGADSTELEPWSGQADWPGPLVRHLLGRLSWEEAEAAAMEGRDERQQLEQLCELHGFAGLWAERDGEAERARAHYDACLQTGRRNFLEWQWARDRRAGSD